MNWDDPLLALRHHVDASAAVPLFSMSAAGGQQYFTHLPASVLLAAAEYHAYRSLLCTSAMPAAAAADL